MNHRLYCFLPILLLVIALTGCTPKVWEVEARYAEKIDTSTGFRAYYTKAAKTKVEDVKIYVVSQDSLLGGKQISNKEGSIVYPIAVGSIKTTIMRPARVIDIFNSETAEFNQEKPYVVLGVFDKMVTRVDSRGSIPLKRDEEILPGGYSWGTPIADLQPQLIEAMENCLEFAANYGANAIVDVSVYFSEGNSAVARPPGIMIRGTAIAYTDESSE